jgi:predicted RNA-binding Zn-ribbon protein involved in translation (DUF1610 family)
VVEQSVKWKTDTALPGQSRTERFVDGRARQHVKALQGAVDKAAEVAAGSRDWKLRANKRALRIAKKHGALGDKFVTELEELANCPRTDCDDPTVQELEQSLRSEMAGPVADLRRHVEEEEERWAMLLNKYGNAYLRPLWTDAVEARYQAFVAKRKETDAEGTVHTRRYFLRYKVEKRMRRRAKWRKKRVRAKVRRDQNREMKTMIPVGTSYVFCGRLNYHTFFNLSKTIIMYFNFLALASFHDRMRNWCENIGAVLVATSEGLTTKKCPKCGRRVNVGAAEVFECSDEECGFRRPRDIKGAFCNLLRPLAFLIRRVRA